MSSVMGTVSGRFNRIIAGFSWPAFSASACFGVVAYKAVMTMIVNAAAGHLP